MKTLARVFTLLTAMARNLGYAHKFSNVAVRFRLNAKYYDDYETLVGSLNGALADLKGSNSKNRETAIAWICDSVIDFDPASQIVFEI